MKQITQEEYNEILSSNTESYFIGAACFMGGVGSKGTDKFIEIVEDEMWLCDSSDYTTSEYEQLRSRQQKEAEKYMENYG